ncbi:MAG: L-2-amino-thiazoline-4-carboxylic acid hydrolase [Candidatus Aminicenantes bacterium]|nr:L-2-amino-thiazoline-4-carboxylic acid hydrolase [Candidatus Aminicenantes bacterium]
MNPLAEMDKDFLLEWLREAALNWLTHDGLWFRAVEEEFGLETAIYLDKKAWEKFSVIEAKRIIKRINLPENGGIPALAKALNFRLYAQINDQAITEISSNHCIFEMRTCRVQEARKRQGLPDFPCKEVGLIEYSGFARTIDPRIKTRCLFCPPDPHPPEAWCRWEFRID